MSVQTTIENKLQQLQPQFIEVVNESHMHGGSATESHFKVTIVSDAFAGERLLNRHRQINKILASELEHVIHALAIHTYTPEEWQQRDAAPSSPDCRGGSQLG